MKKTYLYSLFARCLTLLVLALLSTNLAWGETVTYQHVFNAKPDTGNDITLSGVKWKISATNLNAYNSGNYAGVQFGTKNANGQITLTSPTAWSYTKNNKEYTLIKEIRLWLNLGGTSVTPKVTIGGKEATKNGTVTKNSSAGSDWTKASKVTFTPAEGGTSGIVVIDVTSVKAGYICALEIDCEEAVTKTLSSIAVKTSPTKVTYNVGEKFAPAGLVITATYDTGDEDIAYAGNESDFSFNPTLTTPLTTSNTSVAITYGGKETTQAITVNKIQLATPTNLNATLASTCATLTWDAVANASSYEVNINNQTLTAETNSLLVEDLTASTTYTWTVKAIGDNITYEESESASSNFTTLAPPSVAYTVTFDGNNHGTPASASITEPSAGAGVTLPDCTPNAGYQFVGWATSETATEAEYEAGATYYPTTDITLFAVYNEVYTINYMVNGKNTDAQENVVKGTALVFPEVSAPDVDHVFCGWVTEAIEGATDTEPTYVNTTDLTATADATYYAVFAEISGSEPAEQKTQTLQYDTWTYYGSTTDKDTYRLFHSGSYIESAEFDLSKVSKVIVYGGSFGGGSNNSLTIGDGTNTWKSVSVSGSSQTGTNTYTDGTPLSGTGKLRITSNSGTATGSGVRISKVEIFTMEGGYTYSNWCTTVVTKQLTSIELSGEYPTEFWKDDAFSHEDMTVTAHYDDKSTKDVTSSATFTGYDMATAGEQTVTVTYEGKTATYNITVKTIANTQETAYTVAEAKSLIDANPAELAETEVYVKGTVSKNDGLNSGTITYWLDENAFEVYKGKNIENENFTSADEISVGDDVVVYGKIKKYYSTYEFDAGNYLVSHVKASTLEIKDITVSLGEEISPEITTNVPEAGRTVTYFVASENVVKVDEEGKLVTVAVGGPVTVTATLTAEGYKNATTTFDVTVIKALQSIAVKTAPTKTSYKAGDFFNPTGLVITATYSDATTEDVPYAENKDKFTFEPSLETTLTVENTTITITYAAQETIQAIEVRKLYTYDITWMANGEEFTTSQVTEGNALVLPEDTPDDIDDYVFQGWIAAENYFDAKTAPKYIVPAEIIPEEAMTFYAVFAKKIMTEDEVSLTINKDTKNFPTSYGMNNKFDDIKLEGYEFAIQQVYVNGAKLQWRAAGNSSGTGTMYNKDTFNKIQSILIKYAKDDSNKNFTVFVGSTANPTNGTSITPKVSEMYNYTFDCSELEPNYFVLTNGSGAGYLSEIVINYIGLVETTTDYTTSIADANMSITSAKWGTFCAPFAVTIPEGVKAYTADASGSKVAFTEVTTITAGTPVVVYSEEVVNQNFVGAATVNTNDCTSGVLVGVYAATSGIPAIENGNQNYVLQKNAAGVGFYKANNNISLKANRCYMTLPATSGAKESILFDEVVTGINTILNNKDKSVEGIFDLNGRRLSAPRKGVNIINGVKVIVK